MTRDGLQSLFVPREAYEVRQRRARNMMMVGLAYKKGESAVFICQNEPKNA